MGTNLNSTPHSVKQWQLSGTDYGPQQGHSLRSETRFSTWTPLNNKQSNLQLFEERMNLVLHWFDLWTDKQRKHLLHSLLTRCTESQLKYCRDLLIVAVPVTQVDFTVVLPRFLSLYVMSFLSPRDLCSAAQVSWHWRVLDCIWADRCIRRGWFLPYTPGENEFGAWKNHYLVLGGVKAGVIVVVYDHRGTLPALLTQVESAISGQGALRLGLLAPGGTEEIHLLHSEN
uniref:F-box domain-containing protein n=1 Tax=Seriola lalandi dorsalis TaxID=1841481 RepID=A0A3B4X7W5_SERLL